MKKGKEWEKIILMEQQAILASIIRILIIKDRWIKKKSSILHQKEYEPMITYQIKQKMMLCQNVTKMISATNQTKVSSPKDHKALLTHNQ
mgnify:CR=1 FL=1